VTEVPAFSAEANALLDTLADNFSVADAQEVSRRVVMRRLYDACFAVVPGSMR
jgi:hypothetical protein